MRIVSPWRDRYGYVSIMLSTLKEAMRGHLDVHVTLYNNESKQSPPLICEDFGDKLEHVDIVSHDCHHNFIDMLNHEFGRCYDDYIINLDSDACLHPDFITAAKKMIADLPDMSHGSLYNENCSPEPKETIRGIYHKRLHTTMTAVIVTRRAWEAFPKPKPGQELRAFWEPHLKAKQHAGGIDGALSVFAAEMDGYNGYSTVRSYVEHIGCVGAYAVLSGDGNSRCHRARRFLP